ncbi:cytoskeleton-associated protein 5-like isoform X2 [Lineus longissimus]|uniref:cytoskeleton-associated protein 5-like isoform X2 n=1 Tax=Lineus longissimus TaxID=88925 RepID=UPI002B4EF6D7
MGDDSEWLKLPTDEKVQHKAWKARMAGYEEATKLFKRIDDEKSSEFSKYLGLIKKFVTDTNAIAQEKALEAVLAFLERAHVAGKTACEVCGCVVLKCLSASRAKTKERGLEILLMYIEIEKQEVVQDELMKGLDNKNPKIVAACIVALREAVKGFGPKVMTIKPIVKQFQRLLEDRDKTVREETKQLVIEIYKWIGAAIKPQLVNLKPVQISELEAEFDKLPAQKPLQTRFLRSQQDLRAKVEAQAEAQARGDEDEVDGGPAEEVDPYELMEAVNIVPLIPKDFYEKIEAKKWQERREALEAVEKLMQNPKIEPGDFGDLLRALKRVVAKDTNVMLVALGAKCMTGLASGIRKKFQPYAGQCMQTILEKFKERNKNVLAALRDAADAIYPSTNLEALSEDILANLDNKNPNMKTEAASFLARCFTKATPATLPKKLLKLFIAPLLKTINDTAPEVREASFIALGTAMKVVGEKPLGPFIADIDAIKMAKIKDCCDKAELANMKGKASKPAAEAAPAKPAAAPAKKKPAPSSNNAPSAGSSNSSKPAASKSGALVKRPATAGAKKGKKSAAGKSASTEEVAENIQGDDVVEDKVGAILPAETIAGLGNSNWKERLAAMEKMAEVVKVMEKKEIPCQALVRTIAKKPGLKDNNFQVLKLRFEMLTFLAVNANFSKTSASFVLNDLIDKIGDLKNGPAAKDALTGIAESTQLSYVCLEIMEYGFTQKNPKNQAETLNWLAQAILDFGMKLQMKPLIANVKKAFLATNPAVRTAALNLLQNMYLFMGPQLRVFFDDEKPALLTMIDAEFAKVEGQKPPAPTRGVKPSDTVDGEEEEEDEDAGGDGPNVADLVPRNDISDQIKQDLLDKLGDKNWKIRKEGLDEVITILNDAKFITANLGPLPEALTKRLADSNKILVNTTLGIIQTLAVSMGPHLKQHIKTVIPAVIGCLGDSKANIRASALKTMNDWLEQSNLTLFVEGEILSDALKIENPNLRTELLGWLAEKLPNAKKLPADLKDCVPLIFACLEDRNGDVRKKAQEALMPFMIHTGWEHMGRAAGKLKPASKDQVMGYLEKAKAALPAKPVAVRPKTAPAKVSAPAAAASKPVYDDDDDEPEPAAPAKTKAAAPANNKPASKKAVAGKAKAAASAPSSKKKDEDDEFGPPLIANAKGKDQRFKDEKNLKVLKWNFTVPRAEFLDQLKSQMEGNFSRGLMDLIFHKDFKNHTKGIEVMMKFCQDATSQDATITNLDLILKWMTLRFFDTNPSVLLRGLVYLETVFTMLAEEDYHVTDLEANSFIPYLVNKVGDPKDAVRGPIRRIFKQICKVFPASKMFNFIIDGLKSKNSKQRTECLEELGSLVETYGINVCQPSPAAALKIIATQIGERDNNIRSAALNTIVVAYNILGDNVYKYIGKLNDKDQGMLEERIKRAAKMRPATAPEPVQVVKQEPAKQQAKGQVAQRPSRPQDKEEVQGNNRQVRSNSQARATKQYFQLDFDDHEQSVMVEPKLQTIDMEEFSEPVKVPESARNRPPSPSMKYLSLSSNDACSLVNLVMSQIASNDMNICMQGLIQIDEVLKDEDKREVMSSHIDQFLVSTSMQLRLAHNKHMGEMNTSKDEVIKMYRCLMSALISLFQQPELAKEASRDSLKDLVYHLITVMLDSRLNELEDGPQVVRSVNVIVVKIVEKSDPSKVMSALIKLLHECVASERCSTKFMELVMKCLWRVVRLLPNIINDLNVDLIILDLHLFLKAFPKTFWKERSSDTPFRTIKTVLHSLAKLKGDRVLKHMTLIDKPSESEMESYLLKVLKSVGNNVNSVNNKNEQMNGETPRKELPKSNSKQRLSKNTHDMLAEIFKKIGSKENTREGLNDLYDFKQKYPEADLEPFLKKSSTFFQNYIERGLKNIEIEREPKSSPRASEPPLSESSSSNSVASDAKPGSADGVINPAMYMERLKVLRARCGLANTGAAEPAAGHDVSVAPQLDIGQQEPVEDPPREEPNGAAKPNLNVDEFRKRLERVKNASKT